MEKGRIEVRPAISFVSYANHHDSSNNKFKFIEMMSWYNHTDDDVEANNFQVNTMEFDYGTPEDILFWYTKVHEVIKQKPYEDTQAKLTLTELLQEWQGLRIFLQLKTTVTEKIC